MEKFCTTLVSNGYEVHLVCSNVCRRPRYEYYQGIHIHRLVRLPRFVPTILNRAFTLPVFLNPIWILEICNQMRSHGCKVIITRDLPLAPAALLIGKVFRAKTILDMAECYPLMLRCIWRFEGLKLRNVILRNPLLADLVEWFVVRWIDYIIVVADESRSRLLKKDVDARRIVIVRNTPEHKRFIRQTGGCGKRRASNSVYRMLYVGILNPSRGLDTVIRAVKVYIQNGRSIEFNVVGSGKAEARLRTQVTQLGLQNVVRFLGWIDNGSVPGYIHEADVCIVPHYRCSHWEHTIPNKLFDYMAAGRPVIVSDVKPVKRIVEATGCGMVYKDRQPLDLVRKLRHLEDERLRNKLGQRGQQAVAGLYNWSVDCENLLKIVNSLSRRNAAKESGDEIV